MLLGGLKALHVYSNTGQGRSMGSAAREAVQAAWAARDTLLTATQRRQLEGYTKSSRNFKALLEARSPSPQPVRRDYVPAPRPQPQPAKEKRRQAEPEADDGQPPLSKRQLKRLQASQRAEEAARTQATAQPPAQQAQQLEAQQAQQQQWAAEQQQRASEDAEAANGKRFKLTIRLNSGGLAGAGGSGALPEPAPDERLAAAVDDHWRWHEQQRQQQLPAEGVPPPLPSNAAPGGWQAVAAQPPAAAVPPPVSPMSPMSPSAPAPAAPAPAPPAASSGRGSSGVLGARALGLGLNVEAVEHAAGGSPAVRDLLG